MNLLNVQYNNRRVTDGKGIELVVAEPDRRVLDEAGYHRKEIILSIRPEDIQTEQVALDVSSETVKEANISVF